MKFDWRSETDETIEHHFNPRMTLPDVIELLADSSQRAAAAHENLTGRYDIRYGERPKESFDLFPAQSEALGALPPAQIFIHGGYWRMMDKSDYSHLATNVVTAGATHISLNYDLCPEVTLDDIVDEIRTAIIFIHGHAEELGIDAERLFIAGHSAGGHLTAMMLRQDWPSFGLPADVFKGAVPCSGVFEPEIIMHTSINEDVRLTTEMARRNELLSGPPLCRCPLLIIAGGDEPEGFRQQSAAYLELCRSAGLEAALEIVPGTNHFTVLDSVFGGDTPLFDRMIEMMAA